MKKTIESPVFKQPQPTCMMPGYIKKADIHRLKNESEKLSNINRAIFELLRCTGLRITEVLDCQQLVRQLF